MPVSVFMTDFVERESTAVTKGVTRGCDKLHCAGAYLASLRACLLYWPRMAFRSQLVPSFLRDLLNECSTRVQILAGWSQARTMRARALCIAFHDMQKGQKTDAEQHLFFLWQCSLVVCAHATTTLVRFGSAPRRTRWSFFHSLVALDLSFFCVLPCLLVFLDILASASRVAIHYAWATVPRPCEGFLRVCVFCRSWHSS